LGRGSTALRFLLALAFTLSIAFSAAVTASDEDIVGALIAELDSPDRFVRANAARQLAKLGPQGYAAGPALLRVLSDVEPMVCSRAIEALGAISYDEDQVIPALIPMLADSSIDVVFAAQKVLSGYDREKVAVEVGRALVSVFRAVSTGAERAMGNLGIAFEDVTPGIIEVAREGKPRERAKAIRMMGNEGQRLTGEPLSIAIEALFDADADVCLAAVESLAGNVLTDQEVVDCFAEILRDEDKDWVVRLKVADVFVELGSSEQPAAMSPDLDSLIKESEIVKQNIAQKTAQGIGNAQSREQTRDPRLWPFSETSIWNMPIGDGAVYVHAKIKPAEERGLTVDEDYIVMTPDAPVVEVHYNDAGWDSRKNRLDTSGPVLFSVPIPDDFVVHPGNWIGGTPNAALAALMPDGRTVVQSQPFARPEVGGPASSMIDPVIVDLYGDGIAGAHGGSGMSALGGTIRVGELVPGGTIRHALKVNINAPDNIYYDEETRGYRWPALTADSYAERSYGGKVPECRMGALLALPPWMNIEEMGFETEPGLILARAFQDYGAYLVDDTAWDVYAIETEWGPAGRVVDEFKEVWGFSMTPYSTDEPFARDIRLIFTNLHVVDNNGPRSIGGGGTPRQPLAPPLKDPDSK